SDVAAATGRAVPIVASGGISTPEDVRACLDAGATAVQLYSGLIYLGPGILGELTRGLSSAPPRSAEARPTS
ncbi:MAG: dihydroorotate dehydrogenase (quinone), partial [Actinobacteria bacterium]|nr:dihydroorotate dehydrogenase (quinone) [Actinomycetota bacterium]